MSHSRYTNVISSSYSSAVTPAGTAATGGGLRFGRPLRPLLIALALLAVPGRPQAESERIRFVFTSDAHYGIARETFRGASRVSAHLVNMALVAKVRALEDARFPMDGGVSAGQPIGPLDFLAEGGDVANREEGTGADAIPPASRSWSQFISDYVDVLPMPVYVVPGNHDASNAVGFYKPMTPPIDKTPMVEIFNRMLTPHVPKTPATFDYSRDRVQYARDIGGIHFVFLHVWPDSAGRAWMERDLASISSRTPVAIFVHDQPDAEAKHFRNPNGPYNINAADKFENLLSDTFADGHTIEVASILEQTAFEEFLHKHPNVTAYFHGNSNWNEFYQWRGPRRSVKLHVFRVDSPIKGKLSAVDEAQLSFQVVTIDTSSYQMTVRECLWNRGPGVAWGATETIELRPPISSTRN
jgi:hypothetical protein